MDFSEPYDVVVAGGGNAALCAAITAARAGCRVIVLEGAPEFYRGGNTRHTRNLRLSHDGSAPTMTGPYGREEFLDDLYRVTGGETDKVLAELTIARSSELLGWMDEQGVRFQPPLGGTLSLGKTNAFFLGGGRGALNALYRRAEMLGVTCVYDSPVTALNIDGRLISSRRWSSTKARMRCRSAAARWSPPPAASRPISSGSSNIGARPPTTSSSAARPITAATCCACCSMQASLPVGDPTQCHAVAIDARAPKFDGGIATRLDSVIFGIVVNRDAQRFYDEGEDIWPKRYAIWGRLIAQQAGSDRLFDRRREIDPHVHAVDLSGRRRRPTDRRTGRQARSRSGGA